MGCIGIIVLIVVLLTFAPVYSDNRYNCTTPKGKPTVDARSERFEKGLNVLFILHSSASIPDQDFTLIKQTTNNIVEYLYTIGTDEFSNPRVKFGLLTMHSTVSLEDDGTENRFIDEFLSGIWNLTRNTSGTNVASALEEAINMFEVHRGNKLLGPNLCIMLTAAPPDNVTDAIAAAKVVKDAGVSLVVLTVGDNVDKEDYEGIASNRNVIRSVNGNTSLTSGLPEYDEARVLPRHSFCYRAYRNLVIIVDITKGHKEALVQLKEFTSQFNLDSITISVSIIRSPESDKEYMDLFQMMSNENKRITMEIIDERQDLASHLGHSEIVLKTKDKLSENLIMLVTDSGYDASDIPSPVQYFKKAKIHILCLGIGADITKVRLLHIVTDPDGIYQIDRVADLKFGLDRLNGRLCPAVCDRGWKYHDGMCYYTSNTNKRMSWLQAKQECAAFNGNLVSITSAEKMDWIRNNLLADSKLPCYIGLRKYKLKNTPISTEMRWESGQPLLFSKWRTYDGLPEPAGAMHESCIVWVYGGWADFGCSLKLMGTLVCEREAGNNTIKRPEMDVKPLWNENACQASSQYFSESNRPILVKGDGACRPVFETHTRLYYSNTTYGCSNGELVSKFNLCDGISHCRDGSDEQQCPSSCSESQFRCDNGRCISLVYTCDFWDDCGDDSDETNCAYPPCPSGQWSCHSGQCVASSKRCDLVYDCFDRSDEMNCGNTCRFVRCFDGTCIPTWWVKDGVVDCGGPIKEDETSDFTGKNNLCFSGYYRDLFILFAEDKYKHERSNCTMVYDGHGKSASNYDRDLCSGHVNCPIGFHRCPNSFCILLEKVCDGTMDCINGEEEIGCDTYICPSYFRCPGTNYCIYPAFVCNGEDDCPGGRDEVFCDFNCSTNCTCRNGYVCCNDYHHDNAKPLDHRARILIITNSTIKYGAKIFSGLHLLHNMNLHKSRIESTHELFTDQINLRILNISRTGLHYIRDYSFLALKKLHQLDMSFNPLDNISPETFFGLSNLKMLVMKKSNLKALQEGTFSFLHRLAYLDLTENGIHSVSDGTFNGLKNLNILLMKGNAITNFTQGIYRGLEALGEIQTDVHRLCCAKIRPKSVEDSNCHAPADSISSCDDLMANDLLRSSIWILCLAALVGNVTTILLRVSFEKPSFKNGFGVFVTNLGISDFLMGVYLMIIAAADRYYKGRYIWTEDEWRGSGYCKLAGFLSTLSSEASTFFICLITLDRFLVIKYPFGQLKFRFKSASVFSAIAWICALVLAGIPLLPAMNDWNFYTKNGACLALPFSTEKKPGWVYSTILFIGINLIAFLLIALGQYSIYRAMQGGSLISTKERSAQEMAVARKLFLIVATDFLCWFPVGVMSILALAGTEISGQVYAWTAVFVLPVNSAINPFLYTIPAVLQKMKASKKRVTDPNRSKSSVPNTSEAMKKSVQRCEFTPNLVILEDVLKQTAGLHNKLSLIHDVMSAIVESNGAVPKPISESNMTDQDLSLSSLDKPNAIYLGMHGNVLDRICVTNKKDHQCDTLTSAILSHLNKTE